MNQVLHKPVLLSEVLTEAEPVFSAAAATTTSYLLDLTLGRGGHTSAFLERYPQLRALGVDQDRDAITYAREQLEPRWGKRLHVHHGSFHDVAGVSQLLAGHQVQGVDLMLLDLGVSSPQLDTAERGFSFYYDGPLDMRMNQETGLSAAELVNESSEEELLEIFREYGEIRNPGRVVQQILAARSQSPLRRTLDLAGLIERTEGWRRRGHHPATEYFLALRLVVNKEISHLEPAVRGLMPLLKPGGRMLVITFHSLEDRIIKYAFKESEQWGEPVRKKVIQPKWAEVKANPRARSAKLRVFARHNGGHHEFQQAE